MEWWCLSLQSDTPPLYRGPDSEIGALNFWSWNKAILLHSPADTCRCLPNPPTTCQQSSVPLSPTATWRLPARAKLSPPCCHVARPHWPRFGGPASSPPMAGRPSRPIGAWRCPRTSVQAASTHVALGMGYCTGLQTGPPDLHATSHYIIDTYILFILTLHVIFNFIIQWYFDYQHVLDYVFILNYIFEKLFLFNYTFYLEISNFGKIIRELKYWMLIIYRCFWKKKIETKWSNNE